MKGGMKNLKKAAGEQRVVVLEDGHTIMQVLCLRGSNIIEVMDGKGSKSLAFFPPKFQKSLWMKRGSFIVIDESGNEKALQSGSKVGCIVSQVLFHDQIRLLQKSPEWARDLQVYIGERFAWRCESCWRIFPARSSRARLE